ncbi:MAG: class II glutamine amidotransferase [Acidimicrobiales bacterium]|jgi:glutamate synthase domain-containing protein 1|nr:class II glutamine amidotransferase [Acidimicrobiales bacterium]|tara:strand:+ start:791 stop:1720 length:930 start_codon:yes stop_codon:yes gene_type:complete
MCGIAGIIHRDGPSDMGVEITKMLQSMKHRGPDSTGYALYSEPDDLVAIRFMLAEPREYGGFGIAERLERSRAEVESRLAKIGADLATIHSDTGYAFRATVRYDGDLKPLADYLEDVPGCEVLSLGSSLEIVKDLGDANTVMEQYSLDRIRGTHAIGHVRMATESDVDLASAHPYWAYPFADVAVVHNGQLTNYHQWRRRLERSGHRFQSECDSEIIAVYLAEKLEEGSDLETAMRCSLDDFDGVFTYLVATGSELGVAKDEMAAKPLVLFESDDLVVMASEEMAISALVGREVETRDPLEREVLTWQV